jgi:hypothetical protein
MCLTPITSVLPVIICSVLAAVAAAIGALLIYIARRHLPSTFGLLIIRLAAIAVFTIVLVGLGFVGEKTVRSGKPVPLLIDVSSGMALPRVDRNARKDRISGMYKAVSENLENLGFKTKVYLFADGLFAVSGPELYDIMSESGHPSSNIAAVLEEIAAVEKPKAVMVISDGIWREVPTPPFPVFTFPVVSEPTLGFYPVSIRVPRYVLSGTRFPIEITFAGSGDGPFDYSIYDGDERVLSGRGSPGSGTVKVEAFLNAESEGGRFYKVETDTGYAPVWFWVEVLRGPLQVYFRSMNADPDTAFLRRAIIKNQALECDFRQDLEGGRLIKSGLDLGVSAADVIVLANPRAEYLDNGFINELEKEVLNGTGLLVYFSVYPPDLSVLSRSTFNDLSPVRARERAELSAGGSPRVTPASGSFGFRPARDLEFRFFLDVGVLKPSAVPLWVAPGGQPVLSWIPYGRGRVILLTAGGLAEWELSRSDGQLGLTGFAADLILFLYGDEEGFTLSNRVIELGERVETYVLSSEKPTILVGKTGKESKRLSTYESSPGVWTAEWEALEVGRYTLTARRFESGRLLVEKKEILITGRTNEKIGSVGGVSNLARLAELSGGRYYSNGTSESFGRDVVGAVESGLNSEMTRETILVMPLWFGLALFIGLLVTEWILKRLSGLA